MYLQMSCVAAIFAQGVANFLLKIEYDKES